MDFNEFVLITVAGLSVFGLGRVLIGPTIWDRMLGFSVFSSKVIVATVMIGVLYKRTFLLDVALIYGVLGFLSTIMISRFVEKRGDI
ncbi:monovalent cation/H+ antiporter complex subunit F [Alkalibacterium putridalgicola]|jgi:multicomponent Na+:H+ antiporter subunit F|uniref:Cation:proton antiporter n=1 Tax=Alkalibacterium putridalgicola TaxID=426703 RepID=A0A1H7SAQ6_9LACT|nr:monovalent cation/H+ antiporter complex subunit F [Alkalibacterium putridalgicola]GEK89094.1 cation:proton antiporter [Alkalibacterium putridalgicola]SEL68617.1 multicomponent Na+:H+ antiporter subunit F [Alkalibacterium putridalgicola]